MPLSQSLDSGFHNNQQMMKAGGLVAKIVLVCPAISSGEWTSDKISISADAVANCSFHELLLLLVDTTLFELTLNC